MTEPNEIMSCTSGSKKRKLLLQQQQQQHHEHEDVNNHNLDHSNYALLLDGNEYYYPTKNTRSVLFTNQVAIAHFSTENILCKYF